MQDVLCIPNEPLTPSKVVASNTATLDFGVNLDTSVPVEQGRSTDEVTVQAVEYSETTCVCCLCQSPEVVMLPVVSCNALSTDSLDPDLGPVMTFDGKNLVNGYFADNCIDCNSTQVSSASGKVRGNIRERFRIPREDPKSDPSETMRKFSTLENMCYLNGLYVDIIPKNLSVVWSQIIGRPVTAPERFAITSATSQEMMKLRRQ